MSWFVVATKPNAEQLACTNLARQGFTYYLPMINVSRSHARKVEIVKRPLFPRYVFVEMDIMGSGWSSINSTYGVQYILSNNGLPQAIKGEFVEALMAQEEFGILKINQYFKSGDMAKVCGGPFDEQIGEILSANQSGRIRILMNLMGGEVITSIIAERLVKVN